MYEYVVCTLHSCGGYKIAVRRANERERNSLWTAVLCVGECCASRVLTPCFEVLLWKHESPNGGFRVGVASIASRDHRNAKNSEEKGKLKPVIQDNISPALCYKFLAHQCKSMILPRIITIVSSIITKNNILYNSYRYIFFCIFQ